jgi:hypothetical protein
MHPLLLSVAAVAVAGAASAQTPPPPPPGPPPVLPRVFQQAGYSEPEIGPASCKAVNASETQCAVPAMTAGRYLIRAAGASTAQSPDAAQELRIVVGDQVCTAVRNPAVATPWAVGTKRTFYSGCLVTILTDTPIAITALYADAKATKDPQGPQLTVLRQPWPGAFGGGPVSVNQ